jgi:hypothetical protein
MSDEIHSRAFALWRNETRLLSLTSVLQVNSGTLQTKRPPKGGLSVALVEADQEAGNSLSVARSRCCSEDLAFARCPTSSPESL